VLDAEAYIRQELAAEGIPFVRIEQRIEPVEGRDDEIDLFLDVTEGQRVTVAEFAVEGNEYLSAGEISGAMDTKPEGFWWFRSGGYDELKFETDLAERLPALYRSRGYLDFRVVSDTLIVDPTTGKARLQLEVDEGPQYRLGSFTIEGNEAFTDEQLEGYFIRTEGGLLRSLGFGGDDDDGPYGDVFDSEAFNTAILTVRELYANEGYLYVQVSPVINRVEATEEGQDPTVDVSWNIIEGAQAIVNRVAVAGNEYTYEWVIRNQIFILPGDVYSQDRVLRSYQSISSLGFFEAPLPFPDIQPLENGDVDLTFNVVEKQTGSINFGTSVGGGVGLSGFLGYEQPNLYGQAKSGTLRWDFGRYISRFEVSYSDPALLQSMVSGSVSLFNSRDRFFQFATGRRKRLGTNVRFGFPWPNSRVTRVFLGYGLSRTTYEQFNNVDDNSLFGRPPGVQSQLSLGITRQTLDHPLFPTVWSKLSLNFEANGGPLGGDGDFTRALAEGSWWIPAGGFGSTGAGGIPAIRLALGLSVKGGAVFGDADRFPFERFWMGGVQFGQNLRGYDETTITPSGYFPERSTDIADINRLGNAFLSVTAEYALRLNDQISISAFYDAGNVWTRPSEIDPTHLFRGAGFGVQLVTPFGPIGLDYAYGFDRPNPGWQLHFRMGPGF
jgi:outer membrane protein insertion porin family